MLDMGGLSVDMIEEMAVREVAATGIIFVAYGYLSTVLSVLNLGILILAAHMGDTVGDISKDTFGDLQGYFTQSTCGGCKGASPSRSRCRRGSHVVSPSPAPSVGCYSPSGKVCRDVGTCLARP